MKFEPQVPGVTRMLDSSAGEIIHLFGVMQKYGTKCSLEFKADGTLDPLYGFSNLPIELIEYFESNHGPDSVLIELGENSFNFELGTNQFVKIITDSQIDICIASDHYSAWFNSDVIPPEGIEEARNYKEPEYGIDGEFLPAQMELSTQEKALISFIRSISFDDVLDATIGIEHSANNAGKFAQRLLMQKKHFNAQGFKERQETLLKLSELLGDANADFRAHINPEEDGAEQ